MQIPLCAFYAPDGSQQYLLSHLDVSERDTVLNHSFNAILDKLYGKPTSAYLGVVYRSSAIQIFAFFSCTGWTMVVGLENGPFDGDEVRFYLFIPFPFA